LEVRQSEDLITVCAEKQEEQEEEVGNCKTKMGMEARGCGRCARFLTDREQRKVWGVGVLYVVSFPVLLVMLVVGAIRAKSPDGANPWCPAEPNLPWMLVVGGAGVTFLLLVRVALVKIMRWFKNKQRCCSNETGCCCELGCTVMSDVVMMAAIIIWMITVSWWVFRHWVGPGALSQFLGDNLEGFRAALGDTDTIHQVQFADPDRADYCDRLLYLTAFATLSIGWLLLFGALLVLITDKILSKLICRSLCKDKKAHREDGEDPEEECFSQGRIQLRPHAALRNL